MSKIFWEWLQIATSLKRTLPTQFLRGILRVALLWSNCYWQVLKIYTENRLYRRLKHLKKNTFACVIQNGYSEKSKGSRKILVSESWFSNVSVRLYQNETSPRILSEKCSDFFSGQLFHKTVEWLHVKNLYSFNKSNNSWNSWSSHLHKH